jgi:uncharacterized protein YprB with RNaseH-like and TPR domain
MDLEGQLARLKQRVAAIDARYATRSATPPPPAPSEPMGARFFIEEWSEGEVVSNDFGEHFQLERLYARHKQHGSADIGALAELPENFLDTLSNNEIASSSPERWAFLDTETTGLMGGSGTYAFLIGVGRITSEGFRVRQFFMREYAEERSILAALENHLRQFDVLITYNGKSYDQPLLETRYRMTRQKPPFSRLGHLDLLHGARRLWKLRLENCRLVQLEQQILGMLREGDLAGELIPYVYFDFLRSRDATRLVPIFHHNAMDILTLACLTAIVPAAFGATDCESLAGLGISHGADLAGLARWLLAGGEYEQALALFRRAVKAGLSDSLLFRTLWDVATIEKKLGRPDAALAVFVELAGCRNEYRVRALEELAKFYEHSEKNLAMALDFTYQALSFTASAALLQRKERLHKRLSKPRTRKLL